jgi:hypothetical protein
MSTTTRSSSFAALGRGDLMTRAETLLKYPRTQHIQGSRLQPGDEDLSAVPLESLLGQTVVIEEKIDGANCGVSFSPNGELLLQAAVII